MKKMLMGLWLLTFCSCSTLTKMSERVNEEIDVYRAEREKTKYVQVVYPAELLQYGGARDDASYPFLPNNGGEEGE